MKQLLASFLSLLLSATYSYAASPDFKSNHLALGLSPTAPAFRVFAVDSLGQGKVKDNPVLANDAALSGLELHGCEGLLVDNYHSLLAVLDDVKAN